MMTAIVGIVCFAAGYFWKATLWPFLKQKWLAFRARRAARKAAP